MSTTPSLKTEFRRARKHEWKLCDKIKAAHKAGKSKRLAYLTNEYLNSYHAKYVAVVKANCKLPRHRRRPKKELRGIAAKLDPWNGTQEKVVVHYIPKESNENDFRPIYDFGIENRALQYLVNGAFIPQSHIHPCQFAVKGGTQSAAQVVIDGLNEGFTWIAEIDIKDCYPSFDGEKLSGLLPIPDEVIENSIISHNLNLYPGNLLSIFGYGSVSEWVDDEYDPVSQALSKARLGIPQGSAASSFVVENLLAPVVGVLSKTGRPVTYADNFLVMAKEQKDVVSMLKTLGTALKCHPAGPLQPKVLTAPGKHKGFNFLGFRFFHNHGNWVATPSAKNRAKFDSRFARDLNKATNPTLPPEARKRRFKNLIRYVRSWTAAFSIWNGVSKFRETTLAKISHAKKKLEHSHL